MLALIFFLWWPSSWFAYSGTKKKHFLGGSFSVRLLCISFVSHIFLSHRFLKCWLLKVQCRLFFGSSPSSVAPALCSCMPSHSLKQANLSGKDWTGTSSPSVLLCSFLFYFVTETRGCCHPLLQWLVSSHLQFILCGFAPPTISWKHKCHLKYMKIYLMNILRGQ